MIDRRHNNLHSLIIKACSIRRTAERYHRQPSLDTPFSELALVDSGGDMQRRMRRESKGVRRRMARFQGKDMSSMFASDPLAGQSERHRQPPSESRKRRCAGDFPSLCSRRALHRTSSAFTLQEHDRSALCSSDDSGSKPLVQAPPIDHLKLFKP